MESWESLSVSANTQIDKLIRNMRMGPVSSYHKHDQAPVVDIMPVCTSSAPKKRRHVSSSSQGGGSVQLFSPASIMPGMLSMQTTTGDHSMDESDIVILYDYLNGGRNMKRGEEVGFTGGQFVIRGGGSMLSSSYPPLALMGGNAGGGGITGGVGGAVLHKPTVCIPKSPIESSLLDLHVCMTDGLHRLYPSTPPADLSVLRVLHARVQISLLPKAIAMEQQEALERSFLGNFVRMSAARSMYLCTSCALGGEFPSLTHTHTRHSHVSYTAFPYVSVQSVILCMPIRKFFFITQHPRVCQFNQ